MWQRKRIPSRENLRSIKLIIKSTSAKKGETPKHGLKRFSSIIFSIKGETKGWANNFQGCHVQEVYYWPDIDLSLQIWQFTGSPILHLHENLVDCSSSSVTDTTSSKTEKLKETKNQFSNLFTRLNALSDICGIELQHQQLDKVKTPRGKVMIDRDTWEKMNDALEKENTIGNFKVSFIYLL